MRFLKTFLKTIIYIVLVLLCAALFYVLVVMGGFARTIEDEDLDAAGAVASAAAVYTQASLPQSPMHLSTQDVYQAEYYIDGYVMQMDHGSWRLEEVTVADLNQTGVADTVRAVALRYYNLETGASVTITTASPASCARNLVHRNFYASANQDFYIMDMNAVLMQNGDTLHLYAKKNDIIYQIEGKISLDTLKSIVSATRF